MHPLIPGLLHQIENPVRWHQAMQNMIDRGIRAALEVGPGHVLQGLARNIDRKFRVESIGTLETLDNCEVLEL